jgi:hypothetical protein
MPESATPVPADVRAIPLGGKRARGRVAWVDERNFDRTAAHSWSCWEPPRRAGGRPLGPYPQAGVDGRTTLMHNFITGRKFIDHRNGDGLDCREKNLRAADNSQNGANQGPRAGTSRFKGVGLHRATGRWRARIKVNYRDQHLGLFDNPEDAARAYDAAAIEAFGEFARLNFPPD